MKSAAAKAKHVQFGENEFLVGANSWFGGDTINSYDYSDLFGVPRTAAFYAALAEVLPEGESEGNLVIGLPIPVLYPETALLKSVLRQLQNYKRIHEFTVDGKYFRLKIVRVRYFAQPAGTHFDWMWDAELKQQREETDEALVIDIGQQTVDVFCMLGNSAVTNRIGGSESGVRFALQQMPSDLTHEELSAAIANGSMTIPENVLNDWLSMILRDLKRIVKLNNYNRFAAVLLTGGGSLMLGKRLHEALAEHGAKVVVPQNPATSNACGFYKFAAKYMRNAPA